MEYSPGWSAAQPGGGDRKHTISPEGAAERCLGSTVCLPERTGATVRVLPSPLPGLNLFGDAFPGFRFAPPGAIFRDACGVLVPMGGPLFFDR